MKIKILLLVITLAVVAIAIAREKEKESPLTKTALGFTNASSFVFSPEATRIENINALQKAVDMGGTIIVSQPGFYKIASTLNIGSNTSLIFGNGVSFQKANKQGRVVRLS